jgi:steroid delta-isomerase-like uncharacterized protein
MSTEDNKALMRQYLEEVFNQKNLAALDAFISSNHVDHTLPPSLPPTPEGSKRAIAMYLTAFPDLHLSVEDMIAQGDKVVIRFTSRGTQTRAFAGIPPTGKHVTVSSILIARIADGKIVEQWGLDDQIGMLQQLGVIPTLLGVVFFAGLAAGMGLLALVSKRRSSG